MSDFSRYHLQDYILATLEEIGFKTPTPIQESVIPLALRHKTIVGRSQTGSGKTHAFLIPILQHIVLDEAKVQAIIVTPTRELATQIYQMVLPFMKHEPRLNVRLLSGGLQRSRMVEQVSTAPHLVIGTPGRINDIAFNQRAFNVTTARVIVLDEVDMILESGFLDDVGTLLESMKPGIQMMAFSATVPDAIRHFLQKYMTDPQFMDTSNRQITSSKVVHIAYPARHHDRQELVANLITTINPYLCLVFASKKEDVNRVYQFLKEKGMEVGIIHGDLDSTTRRVMMKKIRENGFKVIVASDIAARGLDVEHVSHVINYDLPREEEFYFHRAGRTGRYKDTGICITLYDVEDQAYMRRLVQKGVHFEHQELKNGVMTALKPWGGVIRKPRPKPYDNEIKKVLQIGKNQPVKPGYKKKMTLEIESIKRKHRRKIIQEDIKRQIRERSITRTKAEKDGEES